MMKKIATVLSLALSASACVDDAELGTGSLALGPGPTSQEASRWVLGRIADGLPGQGGNAYHVAGATSSIIGGEWVGLAVTQAPGQGTCLSATVGGVTHACADPIFNGAVLNAPGTSNPRLRIVSSTTFNVGGPGGHTATGYVVEGWAGAGAQAGWAPYCVGGRVAYPLAGRIARIDASLDRDFAAITFACSEYDANGVKATGIPQVLGAGAFAKALSWGYQIPAGAEPFAAAVAAARASYGGDGASHTLDGTSIQVFDVITKVDLPAFEASPAMTTAPLDSTSYSLDAVWGDPHVDELDGQWGAATTISLSRLRWQGMPVGDRCTGGTVLFDPRAHAGDSFCDDMTMADFCAGDTATHEFCDDMSLGEYCANTTVAQFCDDMTIPEFCDDWTIYDLADAGAAVVSFAQWNRVGLWQWRHAGNGDRYATTVGSYGGAGGVSTVPAGGYDPAANAPTMEGTIMTATGKATFEATHGANAGNLVELRSCKKPGTGDWATGRVAWLNNNGFTAQCKSEGFVWAAPPAAGVTAALGWSLVELKIWRLGQEHTTAVAAPAGYSNQVATVGWIVAPAKW